MSDDVHPSLLNLDLAGTKYSAWIASSRPTGGDDADDEMFLEIRNAELDPLLFVSHFAKSGRMTLTGMAPELPVELVTWAIGKAREHWPSS
jgi:hypothetical protein